MKVSKYIMILVLTGLISFATATIINVPSDSATIQGGINGASPGDTVQVAAGIYNENVDVNKSITLQGASSATVTVNVANASAHVFNVTASNVEISGFTATGAIGTGTGSYAGMKFTSGVTDCDIHDNRLTVNEYGILIVDPENTTTPGNNTFTNNIATNNNISGIEMQHSYGNTFTTNTSNSNTKYGFRLDGVSHNTFTGNIANSNTVFGFSLVKGSSTNGCVYNTFTDNTANSNTQYGLREDYGDHNTYTGNTFDSNIIEGIRLKETITYLTLEENNITNNGIGININTAVTDVSTWTVIHNNIAGNTTYGVLNNSTVTKNVLNAENNWWGASSGPYHSSNPSGQGDTVSNNVDFDPWLPGEYGTPKTITASSGANGSVTPTGITYVPYNGSQLYNITPDLGYHRLSILVDGSPVTVAPTYNFTGVIAIHTISATFGIDSFTITASSGANGSVTPTGITYVPYNGSQLYNITPDLGYHRLSILVDGSPVTVAPTYNFTGVIAIHTISATFGIDSFTITASSGANGSVTPTGITYVPYNGSQLYNITPDLGYHTLSILVDGSPVTVAPTYNFTGVIANHTISATFGIDSFTITASSGANGSVTPDGATTVTYNGSQLYDITPDLGYHTLSILVDGSPVTITPTYNFTGVIADHTINATFGIDSFTITSSAGPNGSIDPLGPTIVTYDANQAFTITPNEGYHVADVLIDGDSYGSLTYYEFLDVREDHTISATFAFTETPGWAQRESIVTPQPAKMIKDGGALVGVPGSGKDPAKLFAFLGTKTNRFKKYTVGSGWSDAESLLFGHKYKASTYTVDTVKFAKKFPGKGAALCYDGVSKIYATKGNGTNEFYAYDLLSDVGWTAKAFVPTLKGLKGGTSIRYYDGKVYLLAGGQKKEATTIFYSYDPTADSVGGTPWTELGKPPLGPDIKVWKDGSTIVELGGTIYALHGGAKSNLFYAYDWGTNTWLDKEPLPIEDSSYHKYKKKILVKDGAATASGNGVIYVIKGGGTEVFWKYTPGAPGVWDRLERMPIEKIDKKHAPKTGAAMACLDGSVYLLVGNKQVDFWRYIPSTEGIVRVRPSTVTSTMIDKVTTTHNFSFDATPNPFNKLTTIRYTVPISGKVSVKLYNATGRLIETLINDNLNAGTYSMKLSANKLAKGIYFVKYESSTNKSEVKLIVQ